MKDLFTDSGAFFSPDKQYRFWLFRIWDKKLPWVMFIGLNPSTANESEDDPTIRRVIQFAKDNGYGGVYMLNLFTVVSADPKILLTHGSPHVWSNEAFRRTMVLCQDTVFCWGSFKEAQERAKEVINRFPNALCLGKNKDGSPKHPLYIKADAPLMKFAK